LPELFRIPGLGITIYTYGVALALAFATGAYLAARLAESQGIGRPSIYYLATCLLPTSLLGTKLLTIGHIAYQALLGRPNPFALSTIVNVPGFYLGGFLTTVAASLILTRAWHLPWTKVADAAAPALALGIVFGRLGCFAAGCCWGKPTTSWFGVTFGQEAYQISGTPPYVPLIPTQLIEAATNLVLFAVMCIFWPRRSFQGQVVLGYMILYSTQRFVIEFWRDDPRGHVMNFSTSQFISLLIFIFALALYFWQRKKLLRPSPPLPEQIPSSV
jgi:phosphatidylglycerol:prolipoprotein diacylglycerol transferase